MEWLALGIALVALIASIIAYVQADGVPELRSELGTVRQKADVAYRQAHDHSTRDVPTAASLEENEDAIRTVQDEHNL